MRPILVLAALLPAPLLPTAARADGAALVLGVAGYVDLAPLDRGAAVVAEAAALEEFGFNVSSLRDPTAARADRAVVAFLGDADEADRLVVALSGRFATDGARTWWLPSDASAPTLFGVEDRGLSVESLLAVLARQPSRAVLLLGVDPDADAALDPWLREGLGDVEAPQGVTVLTGSPRAVAAFLGDELAVPRGDLARLVAENDAIRAEGYLPAGFAFMPALAEQAWPVQPVQPARPAADLAAETALWQGAVALDTVDAYRNYLRAYPQGRFVTQAQGGISAILTEPNRQARLVEEALALSLDQRRAVQRALTLIGFDPRGVDGIFGAGTRSAITDWQQQNGFAQTGYLQREEVARLEAQAARRAAEIDAQEAQTRAEAEAADRAFWEETGARGDAAGLRAYLDRYPEGLFSDAAAGRLGRVAGAAEATAAASDRAAWDRARGLDTADALEDYLAAYPRGAFADDARARIEALGRAGEALAGAQAAEEALGLNALTARVVESRLDALGLDPGAVDGSLDRDARDALRAFQGDRGLPATGYLDEATLVRLLADSLEQALGD